MSVFLLAIAGTLAAQVAPGPNLLAVASVALSQGRRAGMATAAGVASGATLWGIVMAFGMASVFERYPAAAVVLQIIGGCYFLWIALRAMRSAIQGSSIALDEQTTTMTLAGAFRRGLLVVLTNPKAAMMWASISAFLVAAGIGLAGLLAFAVIGGSTALLVYGSYAALFSTTTIQRMHRRAARGVEAVFGLLFGVMGTKLLLDGVRAM